MNKASVKLSSRDYLAESRMRHHFAVIDEPVTVGGDDNAPTPVEYLLTALGSCLAITLRMYSQRKGWDLGKISVDITQKNIQTGNGVSQVFVEDISFEKEPTDEQKKRLKEIAGKCPVAKIIKGENLIESNII
ncbi:OsmC family protein [Tenacibaculum sp. MEBiC06402]|uniref:OsmC family protein n=1 Tax=unclassified Tenacibaculum TaxID=2635139 RepID=UPI003B9C6D08